MNDWQECTFLVRNLVVTDPDSNGEQVITGEFSLMELQLIVSHFQPNPPRP
jgi:hypothetical protein